MLWISMTPCHMVSLEAAYRFLQIHATSLSDTLMSICRTTWCFHVFPSVCQATLCHSSDSCNLKWLRYQYSETNVIYFLFSLLRIKGHYVLRALLAHPQGALYKCHSVYCVRFHQFTAPGLKWNSTPIPVQQTDITHTQYTKCCLCTASWVWASNARNM
jgi:hypothetical protein